MKDIKFSARAKLVEAIELFNGEELNDTMLTNDELIMLALAMLLGEG